MTVYQKIGSIDVYKPINDDGDDAIWGAIGIIVFLFFLCTFSGC